MVIKHNSTDFKGETDQLTTLLRG